MSFWDRVDTSGECWIWLGPRNHDGYGITGQKERAHRVAYEAKVGPIPPGAELDHTCHTADGGCPGGPSCVHRACVNPAHLEPVDHLTNLLRGNTPAAINLAKTHCAHGHPYDAVNTNHRVGRGGRIWRECLACRRERDRRRCRSAA